MIKNLLFDLGGVIMDLDRDRCVRAFEALGMRDAEDFLGVYGQKGAFLALERGDIDADEFRREIRPLFDREVTDEEIDSAFNQFLTGIPQERLRALRQLRKRYGVYLLSNTNPIMMNGFIAEEFRQEEGMEMKDYFDGVVASYVAKCYKPDREIFDYACEKCGIKPEETLFFDDSQANVDAARALGFYAELVAPGTEFTEILSRR
ncbi:HAD family phosphatase [Duncaniella freteri]|jgi:putative hydrolase of the HAD superfamily|uniref:HAD family hydrolase n=2 Tax=Duncaniella TaxID=2518495 RepID=UPI001369BA48|nr:HAD family phosphatase [Duncaniella freteri]NBJ07639.1 HAD family phosphatase [Alistipes sp. Z76]NCE69591.1 HAD family phosphatase [Muribaculaceae bacterium M3]